MTDGLHEKKTLIYDSAGNLVRRIENEWATTWGAVQGSGAFECPERTCGGGYFKMDKRNWRIVKTTTTLVDSNQVSEVQTGYDNQMNVNAKSEYDFGVGTPGPLVRQTTFTYLHALNSAYLNKHILDRPASKKLTICPRRGSCPTAATAPCRACPRTHSAKASGG